MDKALSTWKHEDWESISRAHINSWARVVVISNPAHVKTGINWSKLASQSSCKLWAQLEDPAPVNKVESNGERTRHQLWPSACAYVSYTCKHAYMDTHTKNCCIINTVEGIYLKCNLMGNWNISGTSEVPSEPCVFQHYFSFTSLTCFKICCAWQHALFSPWWLTPSFGMITSMLCIATVSLFHVWVVVHYRLRVISSTLLFRTISKKDKMSIGVLMSTKRLFFRRT